MRIIMREKITYIKSLDDEKKVNTQVKIYDYKKKVNVTNIQSQNIRKGFIYNNSHTPMRNLLKCNKKVTAL